MDLGHGQRRSVLILWLWTALLSAFVLYPVLTQSFVSYVPIGGAMLGLLLYTMFHPQIRKIRAAPEDAQFGDRGSLPIDCVRVHKLAARSGDAPRDQRHHQAIPPRGIEEPQR